MTITNKTEGVQIRRIEPHKIMFEHSNKSSCSNKEFQDQYKSMESTI